MNGIITSSLKTGLESNNAFFVLKLVTLGENKLNQRLSIGKTGLSKAYF